MAALQFLTREDLAISILSIKINSDISYEILPPDLHKLIYPIHFISYQHTELKQIAKEIQFNSYLDILVCHNFKLQIAEEYISYVSDNFEKLISFYSLISQSILQMYLSTMISFHENQQITSYFNLLRCLIKISKYVNSPHLIKIQNLSLSAFYFLFSDIIKSPNLDPIEFQNLCQSLQSFYEIDAKLPKEFYYLLSQTTDVIISRFYNEKEEIFTSFYQYIILLTTEHGDSIPQNVTDRIIASLLPKLAILNQNALIYFMHLTQNVSGVAHIYDLFANSVDKKLHEEEPFLVLSTATEEAVELPPPSTSEVPLRFWDKETFHNWSELKQDILFPERKSKIPWLQPQMKDVLDLIIESAHKREELAINLLDSFSSLALKSKGKYKLDSNCIFLYICSKLASFVRHSDIADILIESPFFDPNITIFNKYSDYEIIDSIRTCVIDVTLLHMQFFQVLLMRWIRYPLLFSEIVHRIMHNTRLRIEQMDTDKIAYTIMTTSTYYQYLHFTTSEHTDLFELARTSIFGLINQFFQLPDGPRLLFSNMKFSIFYLSLLFEVPLQNFVLTNLLNLLTRGAQITTKEFGLALLQIISICAQYFTEQFIDLAMKLVQTLVDSMMHQREITKFLQPLCFPLFQSLSSLGNRELCQNYLLLCIQFFALTCSDKSDLTSLHISELERAINNVYSDAIPQQLMNRLIQMLAGEILPSLSPMFIIRQPKVLSLILKISLKDDKLLDTINFIDQLCQFSALNCQSCHLSEFDHYLIDLIIEMKDSKIEIVKALLILFQRIASIMSSVSVVQRFISLLSPVNGRAIPKNMELYLKTLNSIVSTASRLPIASLPLTEKSTTIEIHGLTASDLQFGFTFVFWINVDFSLAQYKPSIFSITDSKGKYVRGFLSTTNLFCTQRSTTFESNGKVESDFPISTWTFAAVTYRPFPDEKISEMATVYGSKENKPLEFLEMNFHPGPLTCTIGGVTPDSMKSELITRLGPFGLFHPLTREQIAAIYEMGPRLAGTLSETPFFFYQFDEINDVLSLKKKYSIPNIDAKMSFASIRYNTTFADILINFCKVEILLPLFSELDMPYENGEQFKNLLKSTIEILGNTLSVSNSAQMMFQRRRGFPIISHLLLAASPTHIDYQLYIQFFTLMQSFTNERLQIDVVKYILLNMNIWCKADADNHIRIIKHWARVLNPSLKSIISNLISFQEILYFLRVIYYYEIVNEEKDYIEIKRSKDLNVVECRQVMCNIAVSLATEQFSVEDFECLASHCTTCAETKQIPDLLKLLKNLIICIPSPIQKVTPYVDVIFFLYGLFNKKSDEINILIVENIIVFHKYGILKPETLNTHLLRLQDQFSPSNINRQLLHELTTIMINTYPELFRLCAHIALSTNNDEDILWFIHKLKPKPEYCTNICWSFIPIIMCYQRSSSIRNEVLNFLVDFPAPQWRALFVMIINVGLILQEDFEEILSRFLSLIVEHRKIVDLSSSQIFFNICSFYLFSPSKQTLDLNLDLVYDQSVFSKKIPQRSTSTFITRKLIQASPSIHLPNSHLTPLDNDQNEQMNNMKFNTDDDSQNRMIKSKSMSLEGEEPISNSNQHTIIKKRKNQSLGQSKSFDCDGTFEPMELDSQHNYLKRLNQFNLPSSLFRFGLRFLEMEWVDLNLAKDFANYFRIFPCSSYIETYLVILAFIVKEDPGFVQEHLLSVPLSIEDFRQYESGVDLINHHLFMKGIQKPVIFKKSVKDFEEGAFSCIQEHTFTKTHEINKLCFLAYFKLKEMMKPSYNKIKNYPLLTYCQSQLADYSQIRKQQLIENKRRWMRLWRCLAIDHAPWDCNTHGEAHFKRDNTFCAYFCPFKIKRNWKFDHHKDAFQRKGDDSHESESAAELLIKEDLEQRTSKYGKNAPLPLLEISDQFETTESEIYSDPYKEVRVKMPLKQRLIFRADCEYITPTTTTRHEINGVFCLTKDFIHIIFNESENRSPKKILLSEIHSIFFRRSYHRPNSMEIFTTNGRCYYIHFKQHNSFAIIKKIASLPLPHAVNVQTVDFYQYFQSHCLTEKWINGEISNFEYIMHLNVMSGRTFNDLTQYPIFPWILSQFGMAQRPSLDSSESFRDLTKPIGALNSERLNGLISKFNKMKRHNKKPYLYDRGMSNVTAVCTYLLRLEPFTSEYVDTILDSKPLKPEEFFNSIPQTFSCVTNNNGDYRELIPEFFFMPEVMMNLNHIDFGDLDHSDNSEQEPGNVELPNWTQSAFEFIYLHRKALESDYVSSMLNHWIDLIWGFKQRGDEALHAYNVFNPMMYDDIWNDNHNLNELLPRSEIETNLLYIGQVPPQLFKEQHPQKKKINFSNFLEDKVYLNSCTNGHDVAFSQVENDSTPFQYKILIISVDGTMSITHANLNKLKKTESVDFTMPQSPSKRLKREIQKSTSDIFLSQNETKPVNNVISSPPRRTNSEQLVSINLTFIKKKFEVGEHPFDLISDPNSYSFLSNSKFAAISSTTDRLVIVDTENCTIETMPERFPDAVALSTSGNLLGVAGNDATLNIFKIEDITSAASSISKNGSELINEQITFLANDEFSQGIVAPVISMPSYRDSISCCCLNQAFFVSVIGTRDNSLIINSLNKGSTVRVIDLHDARPCLITITKGWGFIVCYATKLTPGRISHYIYVFNINGILLQKKEIGFDVLTWSNWTSTEGFDYILVSDSNGKLFSFEVFYLNINDPFYRCYAPVSSLKYLEELHAVVIVVKDGRALFVPHSIH